MSSSTNVVDLENSHADFSGPMVRSAYDDDEQMSMLPSDALQHDSGRISSNPNVNNNSISSGNNNKENNANNKPPRCWELAYYQPYFDVDTTSELLRIRKALLPCGKEPLFGENEKPDLYGPFWIVATLGFLMAAMSNLSRYLFGKKTDPTQWNSDIRKISEAFSFLYSGLVLIPLITYFILRAWSENSSMIKLMSLYGYSLISFIPACVFCVIPFEWAKWSVILTSFIFSILFLWRNIYKPLPDEKKHKPGYYALGWLALCQLALSAALKFYFFKY